MAQTETKETQAEKVERIFFTNDENTQDTKEDGAHLIIDVTDKESYFRSSPVSEKDTRAAFKYLGEYQKAATRNAVVLAEEAFKDKKHKAVTRVTVRTKMGIGTDKVITAVDKSVHFPAREAAGNMPAREAVDRPVVRTKVQMSALKANTLTKELAKALKESL